MPDLATIVSLPAAPPQPQPGLAGRDLPPNFAKASAAGAFPLLLELLSAGATPLPAAPPAGGNTPQPLPAPVPRGRPNRKEEPQDVVSPMPERLPVVVPAIAVPELPLPKALPTGGQKAVPVATDSAGDAVSPVLVAPLPDAGPDQETPAGRQPAEARPAAVEPLETATVDVAPAPVKPTMSDGGDACPPVPNQPPDPATAPEPAPPTALVFRMPAIPAGLDVRELPAHPGQPSEAATRAAVQNPIDRVLAGGSAMWLSRPFVHIQAKPPATPERTGEAVARVTDEMPAEAVLQASGWRPLVAPPPASSTASSTIDTDNRAPRELAFAVQLKPLAAGEAHPPDPAPSAGDDLPSAAEPASAARQDAPAAPVSEPPAARPQKPRKLDEPAPSLAEPRPGTAAKAIPQSQPASAPRETAPEQARPEADQPARAAEPKGTAPPPPKAAGEAHDIRLEVNGADRRVEVRLTDRGGEVRVAVRTADSHLAGTLRENLPALSSRLAENGFRTETWHPASAATESRRVADAAAGSPARDANPESRQHGGGQQSDADSRRPKSPEQHIQRKERGKDFAWLMSSQQ